MRNKIIIFTFFYIIISLKAFAVEQANNKIKVKPMSVATVNKLIKDQIDTIKLKDVNIVNDIEPDQSFEINTKYKVYYIIAGNRDSNDDLRNFNTCSILLFDKSGAIKSVLNTVGPENKKRPWACDYIEAMSFRDYYPDGSSKVIVLYNVTPPSNERFMLPVILKLDFNKPSLEIDEILTGKLRRADVNTIQEVRSYLKKHLER